MVTHNIQQATRIFNKTAFFLLGKIMEFGILINCLYAVGQAYKRINYRKVWLIYVKRI